ncbi:MAG: PEGA domain-containing protein [Caldiserica bacterium]|nr:PEGA domain-containing protein [Caldisericota bacterium]
MAHPEHIGKYEVLEEIGRGGMGIVYKALHPVLDRYVAIKVLPDYMARHDPEFGKRFLREARIMVDLHHQGIVRVIDADTWEGSLYLVMDFVDGWTVRQVMAGTPVQGVQPPFSLSVERSVDILKQVASALGYAHQRGIIHRDIKPSNILIDGDGHTWITDFGIAKSLSGTTMATQAGVSLGTPEYMAPEQFAESERSTVDGRSDIYSLGCVVYEMLTGKVPFAGETPLGVAYKHVNLPCPHLRQFNPRISPALESIVLTMLAKDRTERYATCEDLLADLQRYEEDESKNLQAATMKTEEAGPEAVAESGEPGTMTTAPAAPVSDEEVTALRKEAGEPQVVTIEEPSSSSVASEPPAVEQATVVSPHVSRTATEEPAHIESETKQWQPEERPTVMTGPGDHRTEQPAFQLSQPVQSRRKPLVLLGVVLALAVLIPMTVMLTKGLRPSPTTVVPSTETVSLSITSTPPGAQVYLDGTSIGTTPVQDYQASVGSHTVILWMSGYNDTTETFDLSQGETAKTLSYLLTAVSPTTTTPVISPVSVPVSITSNPSGAKVSVDGASKGVTPLTVSMKPGRHTLSMTEDGYKAYQGTVEVLKTDTARTVPVTLTKISVTPTTATLTITSTPSGAKVFLDGTSIGTTPVTKKTVSPGTHTLRLTLAGYEDYTTTITLQVGDEKPVAVILVKKAVAPTTATLTVTSTPAGAQVFLDGTSIGTTPITGRVVSDGLHGVRLSLTGYNDYSTSLTLQSGDAKTVTAVLVKPALIPTTGTLTVTSTPAGAQVYLDGTSIGTTPITGKTVSLGVHAVHLTLAGYEEYVITVTTEASRTTVVSRELKEVVVNTAPAWSMFRFDAQHTGRSPYSAASDNGKLKWGFAAPGPYQATSSPVVAPDGTVCFGSNDRNLYAVYPNGTLKWKYQTGGRVWSSPAVLGDGTIYVGSEDGYLYVLRSDGSLKWRYQTGGIVSSSPAIAVDGIIYVGSEDSYLYALNSDGSLKWRYQTGSAIAASPAVAIDGTVYAGSRDAYLYAIRPDGTLKWRYNVGTGAGPSPSVAGDGTVYVGSGDNALFALRPDGTLKWRFQTGDKIYSPAAIGSDGVVYVGSLDYYLYALYPNGTLKWKYRTGGKVPSCASIDASGNIYLGSEDLYLHALSSDGTLRWKCWIGNEIWTAPTIAQDGTIYVGSISGSLHAIGD